MAGFVLGIQLLKGLWQLAQKLELPTAVVIVRQLVLPILQTQKLKHVREVFSTMYRACRVDKGDMWTHGTRLSLHVNSSSHIPFSPFWFVCTFKNWIVYLSKIDKCNKAILKKNRTHIFGGTFCRAMLLSVKEVACC